MCPGGLVHIFQVLYLHTLYKIHYKNTVPAVVGIYSGDQNTLIIFEIFIEPDHVPGFYPVVQFTGKHFPEFPQESVHIKIISKTNDLHYKGFHVLDDGKIKVYGVNEAGAGYFHGYFLSVQYTFVYLSDRSASYGFSVKLIKYLNYVLSPIVNTRVFVLIAKSIALAACFKRRPHLAEIKGLHFVLQLLQFDDICPGNNIRSSAQHLSELYETGPKLLKCIAELCCTATVFKVQATGTFTVGYVIAFYIFI